MDLSRVVTKWQKRWEENKVFQAKNSGNKKFYVLEMYPYPSGSGLHVGHAFNYTIGDVFARYKKMQGYNVLHPMGFDSFGLPAENAAIQAKSHPKKFTELAIKSFIKEMKTLGISYDWSRKVETHSPDYFKWDQWIFLQMYKKKLVYKKKSAVNWCPKCHTVLANEQVVDGTCWRHESTKVELKQLEQWYLKITEYADELYEGIDKLKEWPDLVKKLQKNWIGKSYGSEIEFEVNGKNWSIFTTRPDTLFSVTFMVVSAQHNKLSELITTKQKTKVNAFLKKLSSTKEEDIDKLDKEGVFTGSYAVHPLTKDKIPIWVGNFVLAEYGSGMVMADAHDQRDLEFAQKYNIPLKVVIIPKGERFEDPETAKKAFTGYGVLINSGKFNGLTSEKAIIEITKELAKKKLGKKTVQFKLRDWLISRQRYWGAPIPIYYDEKGNPQPVEEKDLPILLPNDVKFGTGKGNPIKSSKKHVYKKGKFTYQLETDTMDTFVNSSWYQLRYTDANNSKKIFDPAKANYWNPVDLYVGGKEHACMHLIYIRFVTKFLRDLGLLKFDEPAIKLFNQGMIQGGDGFKMSKSRGNVVTLKEAYNNYGLDAIRLFLMSAASPDKDFSWSGKGAEGANRFLKRVVVHNKTVTFGKTTAKLKSKLHKTIRDVTSDIENLKYNLAIIKVRMLFEKIGSEISQQDYEQFLKLLTPFTPHLCEELWEKMGHKNFISKSGWPKHNEKYIDETLEYLDEITDSLISDISDVLKLINVTKPKQITIITAEEWKYHFVKEINKLLLKTRNPKQIIAKIMRTELKKQGQHVMKLIPVVLKDGSKLPKQIITSQQEFDNLQSIVKLLEKEFNCNIIIEKAAHSKEQKAKTAMPGKPGIIIS